mgnify:CR=1 FL=1
MTRILLRALNGPILISFVIVAIALQSSLFSSWPLSYLQPDVVLLVTIWCALRRSFVEGGIITLLIADIGEIHSAAPQGLYLVSYMVIFLLMRAACRFLVIPSLFSYAILTLLSSVLWKLIGLLMLYLLGVSANQWKHTLTFLFVGAAVEGVISIWIYRWLDRFDWLTFKHARAEHSMDEELQLDSEGF